MTQVDTTPDEVTLIELRQLVYRVRAQRADLQRSTLMHSRLLQENTAALHWFVAHANDSWQLDGEQFMVFLTDVHEQLLDYQPQAAEFFDDRRPVADQTAYLYRASVWKFWYERHHDVDSTTAVLEVIRPYFDEYLVSQAQLLMRTGILSYIAFDRLRLPVGLLFAVYRHLYGVHDVTTQMDRLHMADRMADKKDYIDVFNTTRDEHLNDWLRTLLSPAEYATACKLTIDMQRALYPHIYDHGPQLMRDAHHARVWRDIVYEPALVVPHA